MAPRPGELAKAVESVLLRPVATVQDLDAACDEALAGHVAALCVLPVHVAQAATRLAGSDVKVVALISFPFGADVAEVKAAAAERALMDGADDLEVMMGLHRFLSGGVNETRDELVAIVRAVRLRTLSNGRRPAQVRAVVETSHLDDRRIRLAARVVHAAGVDMVVTSSGLGPRSTTVLDVELLREELGGAIAIKAAGGIRTHGEALELIAAGANRVGATQIAPLLETGRR
jgi:deoxyribose-phosphate aldolase